MLLPFFQCAGARCQTTPRLFGYVCLGFNVTIDTFWCILMRLGF